jgi:hypothetical protein
LLYVRKFKPMGLSLPTAFLDQIDRVRGDIPRSKYVLRLLEKNYDAELSEPVDQNQLQTDTKGNTCKEHVRNGSG